MNNNELPELLTVQQMASYLGMGENKAYEMVNAGEIPALKIRGRWRIPKHLLVKWVNEESIKNVTH